LTAEINTPHDIEWIEGDLPDINTVSKNCLILAFCVVHITVKDYEQQGSEPGTHPDEINGKFRCIEIVKPEKYLSPPWPRRWVDESDSPFMWKRVTFYAWLRK